jgi:hypothetical protein
MACPEVSPRGPPLHVGQSAELATRARNGDEHSEGRHREAPLDKTILHEALLLRTYDTGGFPYPRFRARPALAQGESTHVTTVARGRDRYSCVFLIAVVVLILMTVPPAGGRLGRLGQVELRGKPLIFAALAVQIVIVNIVPGGDPTLHRMAHLATYVAAAAFLVANRRIAGMWMIALGALANVIAIAANNGVMPASRAALRAAGEVPNTGSFLNSAFVTHPRVGFLGDIFAIPKWLPLHNVFSVGDVCIAIGAAIAIHTLAGSKLAIRRPLTPPTVSAPRAAP